MADVVGLYQRFGVRLRGASFRDGWVSVRCFTGTHRDRRASARVHLRSGGFRCFTCGAKGGCLDALQLLGVWDRDEARKLAIDYGVLDPPRRPRPRVVEAGEKAGAGPTPPAPAEPPSSAPPSEGDEGTRAPAAPPAARIDYDALETGGAVVLDRAWTYTDERAHPVGRVCRVDLENGSKRMWLERWDGHAFTPGLEGQQLPLYRLPEVLARAAAGGRVLVVEGEKKVDALDRLGLFATTAPGGAGKWREEHSQALRGAQVCVISDCDLTGRLHAIRVTQELHMHEVRVLVPLDPDPGASDGFDIVDHLAGVADTIRSTAPELSAEKVRARLHDHMLGLLNHQLPVTADGLQDRYELAVYTGNPAGHAYLECSRCQRRRVHRVTMGYAYCPCGRMQLVS